MSESALPPEGSFSLTAAESEYRQLRRSLRQVVKTTVPTGSCVLVVSDGDDDLLRLGLREARHFPVGEDGTYAGYLPADDAEAIAHFEAQRESGADFLVFPEPAFWWLEHYSGLVEHLEAEYTIAWSDDACVVFDLGSAAAAGTQAQPPVRAQIAVSARENPPPASGTVDVDIASSRLHERFFAAFPIDSFDDFVDQLPEAPTLDSFADLPGGHNTGYSGWAYWLFYLTGYLEYAESRVIGKGNTYFEYLQRFFVPRARDRGLAAELSNPLTAIERIARRFRDLDYYHHPGEHNPTGLYGPAPVKLIVGDASADDAVPVFVWGSDEPVLVRRLDGHHRLFAARLFGAEEARGEVIPEPRELPHVRGSVEDFQFDGTRLVIRGWCIHPRFEVESFEVRYGEESIVLIGVEGRKDIAERFPNVAHAFRSGFAVDAECELPVDLPVRFEVVPRSDWLPIGLISVPYLPGMFDAGVSQREAVRAVKVLDGMLEPLARRRALETFESVLLWETPLPLGPFLSKLLPTAKVVEADADLVLAYSVLPPLTPPDQADWLRRVHELVRPEGYVVASVLGELVRPFFAGSELERLLDERGIARGGRLMYQTKAHTVGEFSELFEVVDYVEGGVDDHADLVVLRRP